MSKFDLKQLRVPVRACKAEKEPGEDVVLYISEEDIERLRGLGMMLTAAEAEGDELVRGGSVYIQCSEPPNQ